MRRLDKVFGRMREWFNNKDSKKLKYDLMIICGLGVILMIGGSLFTSSSTETTNTKEVVKEVSDQGMSYEKQLEDKLTEILSKVDGIGRVEVMVTLESQEELVPAMNTQESNQTIDEKDSGGGIRTTNQKDINSQVVTIQSGGNNSPVIVKKIYPTIRGVVIVADGADDPQIRYVISRTVEAALNVPLYRIEVLSHN
ncbi:stage III sporulation protein AG [Calorimonas adulescens]|uniref:Stage III sporulation protein AG n=1 Tax=Calorimonas adulescens TaxID=2606906 RepID=A0A5D8QFI7_9THEO|nr:stage III sporulation protein AG [Calorimonas adulescens]TZE83450.1 stage III sporulation protein AG [Calorimonas adulescens]